MEAVTHTYSSFADMKADEYRYWQSRPVYERMEAVAELTISLYAMKAGVTDAPRFQRVVESFNAHDVKYLVVGGYAVSFHAQPRATKDLDIFIKADAANAQAVYDALAGFGAPLLDISLDDLANPAKFIRFGR